MSDDSYFPYYPSDMATDPIVRWWSMELLGCYHQMIDYLWQTGGECPENLEVISGLFRCKRKVTAQKLWNKIKVKFDIVDGQISHRRVTKELQKLETKRLARQEAGRKGADARWSEHGNAINLPMANEKQTDGIPKPKPKPKPDINTQPQLQKDTHTGEGVPEIGVDEKSQTPVLELELQKRALTFGDQIEKLIPLHSRNERITFQRIVVHFCEMVRTYRADLDIFDRALKWAKEGHEIRARNPCGFFVAKVKEETGFEGLGMKLKRAGKAK